MSVKYAVTNLINLLTLLSVTSEDPVFVKENLYNRRPSKPFRFAAKTGNQILVDLTTPTQVKLAAVFNHNLTAGATQFKLKADNSNPPGGGWDAPTWSQDFVQTANFNDAFLEIDQTFRYWMLDIDDGANADDIEIGELFLGVSTALSSKAFLQTRAAESPQFFVNRQMTHYGQDWTAYLAESTRFVLTIKSMANYNLIDEITLFLRAVQQNAGRVVLIPNDLEPFIYYALVETLADYGGRLVSGPDKVLRQYQFAVKSLTKGIALLG